jgi:hypothetical protein
MIEKTDPDQFKTPDPKKHLYISIAKSAVRILACADAIYLAALADSIPYSIIALAAGMLVAELLGLAEEMV